MEEDRGTLLTKKYRGTSLIQNMCSDGVSYVEEDSKGRVVHEGGRVHHQPYPHLEIFLST